MQRFVFAVLGALAMVASSATAQVAPVKPTPIEPGAGDKLTIRECLGILTGLQLLDGRKVLVGAGKPTESVEVIPYKFAGKVRDAISHNIFVLNQVQLEGQAANRRIQAEIGKGKTIEPGSSAAADFDGRMSDYLERPCRVELDHLRDADLNLDTNDIPGTVLAALWKIRDR